MVYILFNSVGRNTKTILNFLPLKKKIFLLCVHCREEGERKKIKSVTCFNESIGKKVSNMSEEELDDLLFHSINSKTSRSKILLKLLPNGHIFVDWSTLPKHRNVRQCVIHYRSLNKNQVKIFFCFIRIEILFSFNQSDAIRVSRKEQNIILRKIQSGHLYEIHVCTVDSSNKIIASSEYAQIQTKALNDAPILRVTLVNRKFYLKIQLTFIENQHLILFGLNGKNQMMFNYLILNHID